MQHATIGFSLPKIVREGSFEGKGPTPEEMMSHEFRKLDAWQKAMQVAKRVNRMVSLLPREHRWGLGDQMRRSAISVPSNIAEGRCSGTDRLYLKHVRIARGSAAELFTQLLLLEDLDLVDPKALTDLLGEAEEAIKLLTGLRNHLRRKLDAAA